MTKLNNIQKLLLLMLVLEIAILLSIWFHVLVIEK